MTDVSRQNFVPPNRYSRLPLAQRNREFLISDRELFPAKKFAPESTLETCHFSPTVRWVIKYFELPFEIRRSCERRENIEEQRATLSRIQRKLPRQISGACKHREMFFLRKDELSITIYMFAIPFSDDIVLCLKIVSIYNTLISSTSTRI